MASSVSSAIYGDYIMHSNMQASDQVANGGKKFPDYYNVCSPNSDITRTPVTRERSHSIDETKNSDEKNSPSASTTQTLDRKKRKSFFETILRKKPNVESKLGDPPEVGNTLNSATESEPGSFSYMKDVSPRVVSGISWTFETDKLKQDLLTYGMSSDSKNLACDSTEVVDIDVYSEEADLNLTFTDSVSILSGDNFNSDTKSDCTLYECPTKDVEQSEKVEIDDAVDQNDVQNAGSDVSARYQKTESNSTELTSEETCSDSDECNLVDQSFSNQYQVRRSFTKPHTEAKPSVVGFSNEIYSLSSTFPIGEPSQMKNERLFPGIRTYYDLVQDHTSRPFVLPRPFDPEILDLVVGRGLVVDKEDKILLTNLSRELDEWRQNEMVVKRSKQSRRNGELSGVVLHASDTVPWSEHLKKLMGNLMGTEALIECRNVLDVQGPHIPPIYCKRVKSARYQILVLSPQLLSHINDPEFQFGRLIDEKKVLCLLYGVTVSSVTQRQKQALISFKEWPFLPLHTPSQYSDITILHHCLTRLNTRGTTRRVSPPKGSFKIFPPKISETQRTVHLFLDHTEGSHSESTFSNYSDISIEVSSQNHPPMVVSEWTIRNPYCIYFKMIDSICDYSCLVDIKLSVAGRTLGTGKIKYETKLDTLAGILGTLSNPLQVIAKSLGTPVTSVDDLLAERVYRHYPQTPVNRVKAQDSIFPTWFHFSANFGLVKLTEALLSLPGWQTAVRQTDCSGNTPDTLANSGGFYDLAEKLELLSLASAEESLMKCDAPPSFSELDATHSQTNIYSNQFVVDSFVSKPSPPTIMHNRNYISVEPKEKQAKTTRIKGIKGFGSSKPCRLPVVATEEMNARSSENEVVVDKIRTLEREKIGSNKFPNTEISTLEPTSVANSTIEPTSVAYTMIEPTSVVYTTIEPTSVANSTIESTSVANSTIESTSVANSTIESTSVANSTIEPSFVTNSIIETISVANSIIETISVANSIIETTSVASSIIETTSVASSTIEPTRVASSTIEPTSVANSTIEDSNVANSTMEDSNVANSTMEDSNVANSTMEDSNVANSTMEDSNVANSTMEDSNVANSTMEDSNVPKSTMETTSATNFTIEKNVVRSPMLNNMAAHSIFNGSSVANSSFDENSATNSLVEESIAANRPLEGIGATNNFIERFSAANCTLSPNSAANCTILQNSAANCTILQNSAANSTISPNSAANSTILDSSEVNRNHRCTCSINSSIEDDEVSNLAEDFVVGNPHNANSEYQMMGQDPSLPLTPILHPRGPRLPFLSPSSSLDLNGSSLIESDVTWVDGDRFGYLDMTPGEGSPRLTPTPQRWRYNPPNPPPSDCYLDFSSLTLPISPPTHFPPTLGEEEEVEVPPLLYSNSIPTTRPVFAPIVPSGGRYQSTLPRSHSLSTHGTSTGAPSSHTEASLPRHNTVPALVPSSASRKNEGVKAKVKGFFKGLSRSRGVSLNTPASSQPSQECNDYVSDPTHGQGFDSRADVTRSNRCAIVDQRSATLQPRGNNVTTFVASHRLGGRSGGNRTGRGETFGGYGTYSGDSTSLGRLI